MTEGLVLFLLPCMVKQSVSGIRSKSALFEVKVNLIWMTT